MNALMNTKNEVMISSREIAEATGKKPHHVNRDIQDMLDALGYNPNLDNDDFKGFFFKYKEYNGRNVIDEILLNKELTMCLITGYDVKQRMRVINRVKELEEAQNKLILPNFSNPAEAARAWDNEYEQKLIAQEKLAIAAPKADVYDKIVDKNNLYIATHVGQKVKMSAKKLNQYLDTLNVYNRSVKRCRTFQQWFVDAGYGIMRETSTGHSQAMFTAEGEMWVVKTFMERGGGLYD